ncbi:hypothetical protein [Pediococcus claussenii]|uniref:hypothetical protein n=1 Tax=Pediococcus claussenii TaxID=187452 RepID=UPI00081A948C|nr:hypothetical protein [Pediococcus claussenii]ANZ70376.1 hypothetical protein AYR57_08630 [Pediococcus claussenii]ANZ72192.1 hypothetical protein AYR58_08630 [Pediococcus claussenii]
MIEDFDYNEQQAFVQMGVLPEDYENQDYFRMTQVLTARSPDDRPEDPMEMLKRLGIAPTKIGGKEEK